MGKPMRHAWPQRPRCSIAAGAGRRERTRGSWVGDLKQLCGSYRYHTSYAEEMRVGRAPPALDGYPFGQYLRRIAGPASSTTRTSALRPAHVTRALFVAHRGSWGAMTTRRLPEKSPGAVGTPLGEECAAPGRGQVAVSRHPPAGAAYTSRWRGRRYGEATPTRCRKLRETRASLTSTQQDVVCRPRATRQRPGQRAM